MRGSHAWRSSPGPGRVLRSWKSGCRAELEEQLGARGRELPRRLHQDHLDLRAAREQRREKVTGADSDGVARARVWRGNGDPDGLPDAGSGEPAPGGWMLNLPEEKHSHGL